MQPRYFIITLFGTVRKPVIPVPVTENVRSGVIRTRKCEPSMCILERHATSIQTGVDIWRHTLVMLSSKR
jgi:hypothetical protein